MELSDLHEIDPDGDTLLILHTSGAPFATCHTGEGWPNKLPQHQSSKSKLHEASVIPTELLEDSDSGLDDESSPSQTEAEPKHMRFKCSSQHLRLASTFFKRLMCGDWKEKESEPGFKWTITAKDWDQDAFLILINMLHLQSRQVPRILEFEMLVKVAVLVDYYDCFEAVEPWAEVWISNLTLQVPDYYSRTVLLRLAVAWVFSEYETLRCLTEVILRQSRGPIHTLGLPIPQTIVNALEEKRQENISNVVLRLQGIMDNLNVGKDECSNHGCLCMQLGCISRNVFLNGLQPLPNPPYLGFSLSALSEAIFSFQYPNWDCPVDPSHIGILENNLLECLRNTFMDFEDGLDLHQFRTG